jgi:hypothetical protein
LSNAPAYVAVAAFSYAYLVGLGLASVVRGVAQASFGRRQVGLAIMAVVTGVGLCGQVFQAAKGSWAVGGPERVPAAYPIAGRAGGVPYRVLWLGRANGQDFPAPGGEPQGVVDAGPASVRFALTAPSGASWLDLGRPATGPGYDALRAALAEVLSGTTRHGGALLASFGIRFVVAQPGDLTDGALHRLERQIDLEVVPAGGLLILRDVEALPLASALGDLPWRAAALHPSVEAVSALPVPETAPLQGGGQRYEGPPTAAPQLVMLSQQFDSRWRLVPRGAAPVLPQRAFGWAVGFRLPGSSQGSTVAFSGQRARSVLMSFLALLWLGALWVTRRPVHGA